VKRSKPIIACLLCILFFTGCQQDSQATIEAEVALVVAATIEALPDQTARPTLTPPPTLTPLPTLTPISSPTLLPTQTPRPTYTLLPTYTPESLPTPTAAPMAANSGAAPANNPPSAPPSAAATLDAALIQITYAQMAQILKSVSGYVDTYEDDNPNDLMPGRGGREKVPVNCHAALDQYWQLLQLEVRSVSGENAREQAAFGLYRQAWERYRSVAVPIVARCETAVANNETLDTLGPDLYNRAMGVLLDEVSALINQAIAALRENP
jgi:hypothetical protein